MPTANDQQQTPPSTDNANANPPGPALSDASAKDKAALVEANKRIVAIEGKLSDASAKVSGLEGELATVKQERDTAVTRVTELTEEVARLFVAAAEKGAPPKLDLPKNARQLGESVTMADALGMRRDAKLGDVVIVTRGQDEKATAEVAELQAKLGRNHRVYAVSSDTVKDLERLGHLR